jgi:peptidoglycan/LPS O-acetylase OafA/YrhL
MATAPPRPGPLPALTGVRFLAALHVVLYHYVSGALTATHWTAQAIVASGPSAVSLFYVLSGAVLVYSCTNDDGTVTSNPRAFWRARFARIYPLYAFALLLDAPFFISALMKADGGGEVIVRGLALGIPALLLVHGWTPLTVFAWNTPGWSLSAEAFFYALFPVLAPRLRAAGSGSLIRRAGVFYLFALIAPLLVTAVALRSGPIPLGPAISGPEGLGPETWLLRFAGFSPLARLPEFLIGICLGGWLRARRGAPAPRPWRAACVEASSVLVLLAAWIALGSDVRFKPWLDSGVLAPVFAVMIAALATGTGPLARLLSRPALLVLGEASYALYILQEPVLIWALKVPLIGALPVHLFAPLFVGLLIAASVACQRFVAEPARVWLLTRRPAAVAGSPLPA